MTKPAATKPATGRLKGLLRPAPLLALGYLGLLVVLAVGADVIAPYDPNAVDVPNKLAGPGGTHWLGTDELGRDQLSRIIYGTRVALIASFQAVVPALIVGVALGLTVAYLGGWWDRVAMRLADVMGSIPALLFAFGVIAVLGRGLTNAMIAASIVFAINFMRLTRALVLVERERLYVDAARVLGLSTPRIMFGQILPNIAGPIVVQFSIMLGVGQLFEAMLSFLGLGAGADQTSWGEMLDLSRTYSSTQPLLPVFPGIAITLTVLAFNVIGDALRDSVSSQSAERITWTTAKSRKPKVAVPTKETRAVLSVSGLTVQVPGPGGNVSVVDDVALEIAKGEVYGLVGESGCGKSMTALALMGLVPPPARLTAGSVRLGGRELAGLDERALSGIRGNEISLIFQDPIASLSPVHTIGRQIGEPLRAHRGMSRRDALDRAGELLNLVGVPDARRRLGDYPFQFSGGMAQRVAIAAALACEPKLLIADEPTTALDVSVQRQVLDLLLDLRDRFSMSILLITHDLGVIADVCDRVSVMYAGQIVETADVDTLFQAPRHPYTAALLDAMPTVRDAGETLPTIPGTVPPPWEWPTGCRFNPRCEYAVDSCREAIIPLVEGSRCKRSGELTLGGARV
ncbi:dipeptide/oligopeptide/nickel ABC transporter permease/ATP-binding protein [Actinocrispum wychmicini]|uniref:Peptide/nickel transport system permease protein n=1 Tax=Actinocrispum wychmicini TaxID=1213861 RepID=A0A4R2J312_9PSEU|nr:dipeptide/oligopeptide/nickel ABC transporter permease/ATP-binding protein [Actinocrispum wychmicini]TCO52274.1 peptide/nickel transport system permease protein [Actinocrispum wychmicini]